MKATKNITVKPKRYNFEVPIENGKKYDVKIRGDQKYDYHYQHFIVHTLPYSPPRNASIVQKIKYIPGKHTLKVNLLVLFINLMSHREPFNKSLKLFNSGYELFI
jgi:hypothetical protein